ncbi:MAG: hypothetical protein ACKVZJ_13100 [Phycisphaerales bacterium]
MAPSLRSGLGWLVGAALAGSSLTGCASDLQTRQAVADFSRADFGAAAVGFRPAAERRPLDENSLLNNARLGMASLAAGDVNSASNALRTAYQLLESGNVNDEGRIFAATVLSDGALVYKGEPYEQAMTYTALAWVSALRGDWENVRVAARASVRRLADFKDADPSGKDRFSREGVKLVESTFALGYLMEGIANRVLGEADDQPLDRAVALNASLRPLADAVRAGRFNALLVVESGRGPRKDSYGEDGASTRWVPRDPPAGDLRVGIGGPFVTVAPAADVNRMSADYRWNNLEDARRFKSGLGSVLVIGGITTAAASNNKDAQIAGLAAAGAGLLMKLLASADTRHNELIPGEVFVAALELPPQGADIGISFSGGRSAPLSVPGVRPGTASAPTVIYLRSLASHGVPVRPVTTWTYESQQMAREADHDAEAAWESEVRGSEPR